MIAPVSHLRPAVSSGDGDRSLGALIGIGSELVVVHLDEPMALGLTTGKLRYLFPAPDRRIEAASRDGRTIIVRDDADRLLWAQR